MKKEKGSTRHILESEGNFKYVLIMEGLACGLPVSYTHLTLPTIA